MDDEEFFDDDEFDSIIMQGDDGNDQEFMIIDSVTYNNIKYLLVTEAEYIDDDEAEALILKEVGEEDGNLVYDVLEEGNEFTVVSSMFNNDDYEIEL